MTFYDGPRRTLLRRSWLRRAIAATLSFLMLASSTGCRAQSWPLWESYTAKFLDSQGRVIDHDAGDRTTTEGEAYAMFFALVVNDRNRFEKLLDWTETNLAQGDLTTHLPAWSWGKAQDGTWHVLDANPAADADLWMAYSLCEAGRLWGVKRYSDLGTIMAREVAAQEIVLIPMLGSVLLPGPQGFHPNPTTWYLNPSYMPPSILEYFARRDPMSPWSEVLGTLPALVRTPGGFAMDWVSASTDSGLQPSINPADQLKLTADQTSPAPTGSYDAIRVYLWAGISNPKTPQLDRTLASLPGMRAYLQTNVTPPLQVTADGKVLAANAPPGFSAAVIPYLHALGSKSAEMDQSKRFAATLDAKSGLYGKDGRYYDQNLALFQTGWSEGRYKFEADGRLSLKWK